MKKTISLLTGGAMLAGFLLWATPAASFVSFGCYDEKVLGGYEHEVWGGGGWSGPPHSMPYNYSCTDTHIFSPD